MNLRNPMKELQRKKGSYLLEAVMTLPICILAIVALALVIRIISICQSISFLTAKEVKEISLYTNSFMYTVSLCNKIEDSVLRECDALTDFRVKKVDYLHRAENIDDLIGVTTEAKFAVENPAGLTGKIVFTEKLLTRGFTGALQDASPLEEGAFTQNGASHKVLVFLRYGEKYHLPSCSVVKRETGEQNEGIEMDREDARRKGYSACRLCGGGEGYA